MSESRDVRFEDATLLVSRWKKGPQANEWRLPLEAGQGKETDSALETSEPEVLVRLR